MSFGPPASNQLKIFSQEPPADQDTFNSGVPSTNNRQDELAIILFSPNLQMIASLDNTNSQVTSNYSVSVSHGFTFSSTQSISIAESVGVNVEVVTEETTVTFAMSITEEWSTTQTTTMSFSCPPGKKAFVYQGTLMSKVLQFSGETGTYSWAGGATKALTQVLVTNETPIGIAPSNPVSIK